MALHCSLWSLSHKMKVNSYCFRSTFPEICNGRRRRRMILILLCKFGSSSCSRRTSRRQFHVLMHHPLGNCISFSRYSYFVFNLSLVCPPSDGLPPPTGGKMSTRCPSNSSHVRALHAVTYTINKRYKNDIAIGPFVE